MIDTYYLVATDEFLQYVWGRLDLQNVADMKNQWAYAFWIRNQIFVDFSFLFHPRNRSKQIHSFKWETLEIEMQDGLEEPKYLYLNFSIFRFHLLKYFTFQCDTIKSSDPCSHSPCVHITQRLEKNHNKLNNLHIFLFADHTWSMYKNYIYSIIPSTNSCINFHHN